MINLKRRVVIIFIAICLLTILLFRFANNSPNNIKLQKPSYYVFSVDWHPDGNELAAATDTGTVDIWNVKEQQLVNSVQVHSRSTQSVAWRLDGKQIATVGFDWMTTVWDSSLTSKVFSGHTDGYASNKVWWNQDGSKIITSSEAKPAQIQIWDVASGNLISTFSAGKGSVALDRTATKIAVSNSDGEVEVRDILSPGILPIYNGSIQSMSLAIWSPNNALIASTNIEGSIFIWDVRTLTKTITFSDYTQSIIGLSWNLDSTKLASVSDDGAVRIWDIDNKRLSSEIVLPQDKYALGWQNGQDGLLWSPVGDKLALLGGRKFSESEKSAPYIVFILSFNQGKITLSELQNERAAWDMDWSPDAHQIATCGAGGITIWNIEDN